MKNFAKQNHFLYQIYYDETIKQALDPDFIPLDNSENIRPDWYEFWVIFNYLQENQLEDHAWYGFFSPKLKQKTGLPAKILHDILDRLPVDVEILLIPYAWDQISYFLNPFEHGEFHHPGLKDISQIFLDHINVPIDLSKMVVDCNTFAFSNFIIAKSRYWHKWLEMADKLFTITENNESQFARDCNAMTSYKGEGAPMKVFIQERLPCIIISRGSFVTNTLDFTETKSDMNSITRTLLQACNFHKKQYRLTNNEEHLQWYWKIRNLIPMKPSQSNSKNT